MSLYCDKNSESQFIALTLNILYKSVNIKQYILNKKNLYVCKKYGWQYTGSVQYSTLMYIRDSRSRFQGMVQGFIFSSFVALSALNKSIKHNI